MRVIISSPGKRKIKLIFPTRLVFNSLTATLGAKIIGKHVPKENVITTRDLRRFMREINRMKRKHPRLNLIDIESADGEIVQIRL